MNFFNLCTCHMSYSTYFDEKRSILLYSFCILPCTYIFLRGIPRVVYIYIRLGNELEKAHGSISPFRNETQQTYLLPLNDHNCVKEQPAIFFSPTSATQYFSFIYLLFFLFYFIFFIFALFLHRPPTKTLFQSVSTVEYQSLKSALIVCHRH